METIKQTAMVGADRLEVNTRVNLSVCSSALLASAANLRVSRFLKTIPSQMKWTYCREMKWVRPSVRRQMQTKTASWKQLEDGGSDVKCCCLASGGEIL